MLLQQGPRIQGHILVQRTTRKVKRGQCNHCGLWVPLWKSATRSDVKSRPRNAMANQVLSLHLSSNSICGSNHNQFANQFSQFLFTLEQCRKLLVMIGGHDPQSTPIVMANNVSFPLHQPTPMASVRTYVIHLLGTYVTILCD